MESYSNETLLEIHKDLTSKERSPLEEKQLAALVAQLKRRGIDPDAI